MRLKNIMGVVCMSGILAICPACSSQVRDSGVSAPESVSQESAVPVSPEDMADLDYHEEMEQVRLEARVIAAQYIMMNYFFYQGHPDYIEYCYIGDDYMYHVQLSEVTDEAKESLNKVFGDFSKAVIYESSDVPVKELQLKDYIGVFDNGDSKGIIRHVDYYYAR